MRLRRNLALSSAVIFILLIGVLRSSAVGASDIKEYFQKITTIEKPFELRDPFKAPFARKKIDFLKKEKKKGAMTPEEFLKKVKIEDLSVVGVLVGKERRAVLRVKGKKETYLAKEGMLIGKNKAELRAILPGGIVLVEKIKNVYDDEEYIETIIPLSR